MSASAKPSRIPYADPPWHSLGNTTLQYKQTHIDLQRYVRSYVDTYVRPNAADWEESGHVPDEAFKRHADFGFLAAGVLPIPEEASDIKLPAGINPKGWDALHQMIIIDEIARCGYLGVIWGINGGVSVGAPPLLQYASKEQKQRWIPPMLKGIERHCLAITEPEAGSDVAGMSTTAVVSSDGTAYIVNGNKKWITQGRWANWAFTLVRTGKPGHSGLSVLMIPMDAPGVSRKTMLNSGVKSSGSTFIEFDDVRVPKSNLIGKEGQGFEIIMSTFGKERFWLGITSNRLGRVALEDSFDYAQRREAFGAPLMQNQTVRIKFSTMASRIEPTYAFLESLAQRSSELGPREFATWAALGKVKAANDLEFICREAQQVFGGLGFSRGGRGGRVEQISRDLRSLVVSGGSEEVLLDMIAKHANKKSRAAL